jgi:polygalacturonase
MNTHLSRRHFLSRTTAAVLVGSPGLAASAGAAEATATSGILNVRSFGARGDGETLDTAALQKTIATCFQQGGGTVYFPPGRYLSGTLFLKSGITLELASGATLLGSRKLEDYPVTIPALRSYTDNYTERSLIYGERLERVVLQGAGIIDGQGGAFKGPYKVRPYLIRMVACQNVRVRGLTIKDSPMWVQHYLACDGVDLEGLTVVSKCNANNDGIDIDGCQRVRIAHCDIQSGDDAIVLKSTLDRPCRQIAITNCLLNSECNAFKLGTESNGGFENIALSNCTIYDTRLAGIALEMVDGGLLERVNIANVTMHNTRCPIFIRLGNRARPFREGMGKPGLGRLRQIMLSDIQATGAYRTGCSITGLPDHPVEDVTLRNIRLAFAEGGKAEDMRNSVPEKAEAYPEYAMFGTLPAYGLFCRHARNLSLQNIEVSCVTPDVRPALWCDDVEALQIFAWSGAAATDGATILRFENVRDALIQGCRATPRTGTFLRTEGRKTARIRLMANDLEDAVHPVAAGPEVSARAVTVDHSG